MQQISNSKDQSTATGSLIAPGAVLTLVSSQFAFTEGPATDLDGSIYFTDQPNDRIWKYDTAGKLSLFMAKTGRSNGLYMDGGGNILSCADERNELWSISPDRKIRILLSEFEGKKLNGPNDLWRHPNGSIYFTDPYYQRDWWKRTSSEIGSEDVYLLRPGSQKAVRIDSSLVKPNGIVGTPDGSLLYIADIGDNKTYRYRIGPTGELHDKTLFVGQGSDGMTLDERGNVYLTGDGVTVYDRTGRKLLHIPVKADWTANLAFGGKERNLLFITASRSVYTLQMQVKGIE